MRLLIRMLLGSKWQSRNERRKWEVKVDSGRQKNGTADDEDEDKKQNDNNNKENFVTVAAAGCGRHSQKAKFGVISTSINPFHIYQNVSFGRVTPTLFCYSPSHF